MSEEHETSRDQQEATDKAAEPGAKTRGNSLQNASEEMVRFMEQGDEPGHVGRGDGG